MVEGRFPAARALWLLDQIGEGCAVRASARGGPEHRPWTTTNLLLRKISHALEGANWQRGGGKGKQPEAIELPEVRSTAKVAGRPEGRRRSRNGIASRVAGRRVAGRRTSTT